MAITQQDAQKFLKKNVRVTYQPSVAITIYPPPAPLVIEGILDTVATDRVGIFVQPGPWTGSGMPPLTGRPPVYIALSEILTIEEAGTATTEAGFLGIPAWGWVLGAVVAAIGYGQWERDRKWKAKLKDFYASKRSKK